MTSDGHDKYRNIPFSTDPCFDDFYNYASIDILADECETSKEVKKCRTIGILQSLHGKFYLADMDSDGIQCESKLRVSMAYLEGPPPCTLWPCPVQVFGTAQWKKQPVIFVKFMQVLSIPMAIRIRDIMNNIINTHIAKRNIVSTEEELTEWA